MNRDYPLAPTFDSKKFENLFNKAKKEKNKNFQYDGKNYSTDVPVIKYLISARKAEVDAQSKQKKR
jgi:hypothetical protein